MNYVKKHDQIQEKEDVTHVKEKNPTINVVPGRKNYVEAVQ